MTTEMPATEQKPQKTRVIRQTGASGAVYGLGVFGAWYYYFTTATTFWIGVVGFFKGLFWPAFLVYEALKYLNM
jgi:hypothetical protein